MRGVVEPLMSHWHNFSFTQPFVELLAFGWTWSSAFSVSSPRFSVPNFWEKMAENCKKWDFRSHWSSCITIHVYLFLKTSMGLKRTAGTFPFQLLWLLRWSPRRSDDSGDGARLLYSRCMGRLLIHFHMYCINMINMDEHIAMQSNTVILYMYEYIYIYSRYTVGLYMYTIYSFFIGERERGRLWALVSSCLFMLILCSFVGFVFCI